MMASEARLSVPQWVFASILLALAPGIFYLSACQAQLELQGPRPQVQKRQGPEQWRERPIEGIKRIKVNAGRPEWSPGSDYFTYHSRGENNYYDIHVMKSDGSESRCLTCDLPGLPNKHIGQASWHPSGQWLVFQAEKKDHILDRIGQLAVPGIGFHNDIWIMSADGEQVYRLTNLETKKWLLDRTPSSAVLQPHFSNDGKRLSWSERVGKGGKWGSWVIRVADFVLKDGRPSIENIRTFTPGANQHYYESNDFMPGDRKMLICGNLEPKQTEFGIDIYYLDLKTERTERLTHTLDAFDECPHPAPDGSKIAYLSTEGFQSGNAGERGSAWWKWARGEFWIMDADGGNKTRLTYFNEPGYPEHIGHRVIPAYVSWNDAGDKLLLGVATERESRLEDELYLVELKK